jgi:uncharacterized integral membrane protein
MKNEKWTKIFRFTILPLILFLLAACNTNAIPVSTTTALTAKPSETTIPDAPLSP